MLIGGFEDKDAADIIIPASEKLLEKCGVCNSFFQSSKIIRIVIC